MSLRDLIDNDISPLRVIQQIIQQPSWYLQDRFNDQFIHGLRLFGAMFKSSLREHLNLLDRRIKLAASNAKIYSLIGSLIVSSQKIREGNEIEQILCGKKITR